MWGILWLGVVGADGDAPAIKRERRQVTCHRSKELGTRLLCRSASWKAGGPANRYLVFGCSGKKQTVLLDWGAKCENCSPREPYHHNQRLQQPLRRYYKRIRVSAPCFILFCYVGHMHHEGKHGSAKMFCLSGSLKTKNMAMKRNSRYFEGKDKYPNPFLSYF